LLTSHEGEHAAALSHYQTAMDAAQEANAPALGAYAIGSASTLPAFRASPEHTLYLLTEGTLGFRASEASAGPRAGIGSLEAVAHAKAGDEAEAFRSVDRAASALALAVEDDVRPRVPFFDEARLAGE